MEYTSKLRAPLQFVRGHLPEPARAALRAARRGQRLVTSPVRPLPDWLIIGAQKSGTTFLYHTMIQQPRVGATLTKETHYFDRHPNKSLRWYRSNFPAALPPSIARIMGTPTTFTGEATPYYMCHPLAPERVARVLPDVKLIAVLRNPVERAYSHYQHERAKGRESLTFLDALHREEDRLAGEAGGLLENASYYAYNHQRFSYLLRGRYADFLELWFGHFPRTQFLILGAEELYEDTPSALQKVAGFVGFPYERPSGTAKRNARRYSTMDMKARRFLEDYFEPHNARLYELLGRDFEWTSTATAALKEA